jgi:exopolyphosphatase / guanosine-5'-triphosphate,3'-diphosphate pyrophosphatase
VPRVAPEPDDRTPRRVAIVDLGSNSFRLVVFRYRPGGAFAMTDEIREPVRLSAGMTDGAIQPDALERARATVRAYASFCRTTGVTDVIVAATSAVRDATNQAEVLAAFADEGLPARVLSTHEEAYYGYLGIVNSMTVEDGLIVDVGGGSAQIGRISRRTLERTLSAPIGAVRMTETFLRTARTKQSEIKALRRHVGVALGDAHWFAAAGQLPLVGTGGTVRTLAAMAQRTSDHPLSEIHGYTLTRTALQEIIAALVAVPLMQRRTLPGLKSDRADIVLAGAIIFDVVMELAGVESIDICSQGLREGLFYERFLSPSDPPLFSDVRRATVMNLAGRYSDDRLHMDHVALLALEIFDGTARAGLHDGDPREREWLWAAAMLHDVGIAVDYHDHHKHGFYLVINAGLPGYTHRELALIALLVRAHRKSPPGFDWLRPLLEEADDATFWRLASCLRLAEQLDRGRAQVVASVRVSVRGKVATLTLRAATEPSVSLWAAAPEAAIFERAFGRQLKISSEIVTAD